MNTCELCNYSGTPTYKSPCYECFDFNKWEEKQKPITNGDRIRSMTDEELAEVVSPHLAVRGACNCTKDWSQEMLEWLKQPVKEDK